MQTMLLDTLTWDLCSDIYGNIAVASEPYASAQDAASAIRTFESECWYNTNLGIPYWSQILGYGPPVSLLKSNFITAAETVPDVVSASCYLVSIVHRKVNGQVQIKDASGAVVSAATF